MQEFTFLLMMSKYINNEIPKIMNQNLHELKNEFNRELKGNILDYWINEVYDRRRRTFYGRITNDGKKFPEAPLSAVFVTRIMWTFAAAYRLNSEAVYKEMAAEAFRILKESFWDVENGGIYWSVSPDGASVDTKKQFYAQAFYLYALSEYSLAFGDEESGKLAEEVFDLIEKYALDQKFGGYFEAKTNDWQDTDDQRLSPNEPNVKKSMNTHLHILEAYTNFYRIRKTMKSESQLRRLLNIFMDKIIEPETSHFHLFFDADWTVRSEIDSYGHDIEGSWLLLEAAEVLGDHRMVKDVKKIALRMAAVSAAEGLGKEGGMYYEKSAGHLHDQYDWWPQAEAVVGFFNAWQISADEKYLHLASQSWEFIKNHIVDKNNGEWFWGVSSQLVPLENDKVNGWKAPYHNGRMCMEMFRRIEQEIG